MHMRIPRLILFSWLCSLAALEVYGFSLNARLCSDRTRSNVPLNTLANHDSDIQCDIACVGAGLGGLCAGAILNSIHGKKVHVFESHYLPGGCAHAFDRKASDGQTFTFDSGPTILLGYVHGWYEISLATGSSPLNECVQRGNFFDNLTIPYKDALRNHLARSVKFSMPWVNLLSGYDTMDGAWSRTPGRAMSYAGNVSWARAYSKMVPSWSMVGPKRSQSLRCCGRHPRT